MRRRNRRDEPKNGTNKRSEQGRRGDGRNEAGKGKDEEGPKGRSKKEGRRRMKGEDVRRRKHKKHGSEAYLYRSFLSVFFGIVLFSCASVGVSFVRSSRVHMRRT